MKTRFPSNKGWASALHRLLRFVSKFIFAARHGTTDEFE